MAHNNGFIDVSLIGPEVEEIFGILLECGVTLPKHNPHCTLMYDKEQQERLVELRPEQVFHGNVTAMEVLGDGLVFHLTGKELSDEHRRLKEAGYNHSFDAFLPHMSITYDFNDYDILKLKQAFAGWGGRRLAFSNQSYGVKGFS